jgi:hypothetical protein
VTIVKVNISEDFKNCENNFEKVAKFRKIGTSLTKYEKVLKIRPKVEKIVKP